MKKFKVLALILATIFMITACGSNKVINGKKYETVGFLSEYINEGDGKQPAIKYEVIWGNVILGIVFVETIIAPIYFFGFSCLEPVGELQKINK